jgi:hypothetical protein
MSRWYPRPGYAIDDQTAIKVIDGTVEVISEQQLLGMPIKPTSSEIFSFWLLKLPLLSHDV